MVVVGVSGPWWGSPGTRSLALPLWLAGALNLPHLVGKDHQARVRLAPDGPTHTLGSVAHGIKGVARSFPSDSSVSLVFGKYDAPFLWV